MPTSKVVVCSTCGKPLRKIPAYLADDMNLFQCDGCFYPGCSQPSRISAKGSGNRSHRFDGIIEDLVGAAADADD